MSCRRLTLCTFLALLVVAPAQAQDNTTASEPVRRFSVNVFAGSHLKDGGDVQAASFGYSPWRGVTLLANVERDHVPTRVRQFSDGFSVTRNGTLTFVSGEVRYTPLEGKRVSPFVHGGLGVGVSRPNVNELFPDEVTNKVNVVYGGGGVLFNVHSSFAIGVDAKFLLLAGREADEIGAIAPVRVGVTWRF